MLLASIGSCLIYWLALFVVCFIVVEYAQDQLYDAVVPHAGLRVALGTLVLAVVLTVLRTRYETMLTSDLAWTVLQALVWFGVFTLVFQFHPPHAAAIGTITMLLVAGLATVGVDSLTRPSPAVAPVSAQAPPQPVRRPLGPLAPPPPEKAPAAPTP
jgi:hypothetical protein